MIKKNYTKIIHITDTHIVPAGEMLFGQDASARLQQAVEHINRHHPDAAMVIHTGDLTDKGEVAAYREARRLLDGLAMPWHVTVGNHDVRELFAETQRDLPRDENGYVQQNIATPVGRFVILDTLADGERAHHGELCDKRLNWLSAQLDAHPGEDVFIFMHHNPTDTHIPNMDTISLKENHRLYEVLKGHDRIRHIFFGHVHRSISGSWRGIPFSCLPSTNHQVKLQFNVADKHPGDLGQPAYGVVLINEESVMVHQEYYLDSSPCYLMEDPAAEQARSPEELPTFGWSPDL